MRTCLAALAFLLAAGCTALEMPAPADDPEVLALAAPDKEPLPFAVAVAPATFDLPAAPPAGASDYPVSEELVDVLAAARLVRAVGMAVPGREGRFLLPPGTDVLLKPRVHRCELEFEGRNQLFLPSLLLWATFVFPSWWVRDETFSGRIDLELVALSARSGLPLGSHTASVFVRRDLDDFQRGWVPLGILLAPGVFGKGNWRAAGREILLPALRAAHIELARWLDTEFRRRLAAGDVLPLTAVSHALCVGLSKYESLALHNLRGPRDEARRLAAFLGDPRLGGMDPRRVRTLLDGEATGEALRAALETVLVEEPLAEDTVLLYFAGYGAVRRTEKGAEHVLLAYDADPAGDEALGLDEIASIVARSRAGRVALVLDAGFAGGPAFRGASDPPDFENDLLNALREMVVPGGGFVVLVSRSGAGEGDAVAFLTEGLAGRADLDADGAVTALELKNALARAPEGAGFTVRVLGEKLDGIRIPFAAGRTKE